MTRIGRRFVPSSTIERRVPVTNRKPEVSQNAHRCFPKPSTRLDRAFAQSAARLLDRRKLVAWAFAVKTRDQWKDQHTGVRLRRTLNLDPLRAEAHHIVPKEVRAVRYDVRNGICLSFATHFAVERGELRIEGSAWFTVNGARYVDASAPVKFVRGRKGVQTSARV